MEAMYVDILFHTRQMNENEDSNSDYEQFIFIKWVSNYILIVCLHSLITVVTSLVLDKITNN